MNKHFLMLGILLCLSGIARAQQAGCFKASESGGLELETDIDFDGSDVFFLGEFHGVYGVSEVKLALIKYLNRRYGITDVFMETGYSTAYLYNAYLASGDTSFLKEPTLIYYMRKPYRDFWEQLYIYNKGLEHKITIRGMDFERIEFLKVLKLLMPKGKEKPGTIFRTLEYIDTVAVRELARVHSDSSYVLENIYERLRDSIVNNKEEYRRYFGLNFKTVEEIMFNVDTYIGFDERNKMMYHNITKQTERDGVKQFIVISGMNHGSKSYLGWRSLCYRLAKRKQFRGKVADIAMLCKNCYDWQLKPEYRHAAFRGPAPYITDTTLINNIYNEYYKADCKYRMIETDRIDDKRVRKFSDYVVLMKDQPEF